MKYCFAYAGKTVRGIAKCSPNDEFSKEKGEELAVARCDAKIAEKRLKRAMAKVDEAHQLLELATDYVNEMNSYLVDSEKAYNEAQLNLESLLSTL